MTGRGRGTEPETVFEADPRLRDFARLGGCAIGPIGFIVGAFFIVLGLTGVIPYDPLSDWWWTLLILAGAVVMGEVGGREWDGIDAAADTVRANGVLWTVDRREGVTEP